MLCKCHSNLLRGVELGFISGCEGCPGGEKGAETGGKQLPLGAPGREPTLWGLARGSTQTEQEPSKTGEGKHCQISHQVNKLKMWCTRKNKKTSSFVFCINITLHINNALFNLHFIFSNTLCTHWKMGSLLGLCGRELQVSGKGTLHKSAEKYLWDYLNISAGMFLFAWT